MLVGRHRSRRLAFGTTLVLVAGMLVLPSPSRATPVPTPGLSTEIGGLAERLHRVAEEQRGGPAQLADGDVIAAGKLVAGAAARAAEEPCAATAPLHGFAEAMTAQAVRVAGVLATARLSRADLVLLSRGLADLETLARRGAALRGQVLGTLPDEEGCAGPIVVHVDPDRARPPVAQLPGFGRGSTRPLAGLVDGDGVRVDFVENELILTSSDTKEVAAFAARWGGTVIRSLAPDRGGPGQHLVRIDPTRADPSKLSDSLAVLNEGRSKATSMAVSSHAGLGLLAAAAAEASAKVAVGVNWVGQPDSIATGSTLEAGSGPPGYGDDPDAGYSRDAYTWSYLSSGSVQDIGVAEGWTLLNSVGRLTNKVPIAVLDSGFKPQVNNDLPAGTTTSSPILFIDPETAAWIGSPWHGTDVASAAAAVPDNFVGAAGPAGPVARLSLMYSPPDFFVAMASILEARLSGSKIINMSWGAKVPWPLAFSVLPFDAFTAYQRGVNDLLMFAGAGNDGTDVDKTTCFLVCWEKHWHTPCENSGILCVGGLGVNSRDRDSHSNFGPEDVDVFAPFWMLVGPTPAVPNPAEAHLTGGTSMSSPYAMGVAALIWAADPGLSTDSVENILLRNRRPSPDDTVKDRVIHAFGAIEDALPPLVVIQTPQPGASLSAILPTEFRATVFADGHGTPTVTWRLNGTVFGTGPSVLALPPPGTHIVRATATFPDGASATQTIQVTVMNYPPTVHVTGPRNPDNSPPAFGLTELIPFHATSLDDAGPLPESQLRWYLDGALNPFATGHNPTANTGAGLGAHTVTLRGCDTFNVCVTDTIPIFIQPDGADQPPTVRILSPANGALLWVNGNDATGAYHDITLNGTAVNPEGGQVTLVWLDNGVQVGVGAQPTVRLRGGCGNYGHRLTLVGTDDAGNVRQDAVTVTVALVC